MSKKANPVALAGAHRAECFEALSHGFDTRPNTTFYGSTLAVAKLARRFGLPLPTARVVAELAGIGGAI